MANEIQVQFTGALGADPEVRTAGDKRVLSMSIAHSARIKKGEEHVDSATTWYSASLWERWPNDQRLDNVLASLRKGDRVDVRGVAYADEYTTRGNRQGVTNRLTLYSIAPNLEYATAQPVRTQNNNSGGGQNTQQAPRGWGDQGGQSAQGWGRQ